MAFERRWMPALRYHITGGAERGDRLRRVGPVPHGGLHGGRLLPRTPAANNAAATAARQPPSASPERQLVSVAGCDRFPGCWMSLATGGFWIALLASANCLPWLTPPALARPHPIASPGQGNGGAGLAGRASMIIARANYCRVLSRHRIPAPV